MDLMSYFTGKVAADAGSNVSGINLIQQVNPSEAHLSKDVYSAPAMDTALVEMAESFAEALDGKQEELVSGENIKTINGESILGAGDISIGGGSTEEEWELIQSSDDVELRSVTQNCGGEHSRYAVLVNGRSIDSASTWRMYIGKKSHENTSTYLEATIPTHAYGGGTWFFIELPKNGPALISGSQSTGAGGGANTLKQMFLGEKLSADVGHFSLWASDSNLKYEYLHIRVWGCKS